MGNINELQEREDKSIEDPNTSNSDQDSSISSDSSNQSLTLVCDRQTMLPYGDAAEITAPPLLQQTNNATIEIASTIIEAVEDTEISIDNTADDSFPLSESAIPASFEILEDLSPVPSDISDTFLTPDISNSDFGDGGRTSQLNLSSLDPVDPQVGKTNGLQIRAQSNAQTSKTELTSPNSTKIAHHDSVSEEIDSIASLLRNLDLDEESSENILMENHQTSPPFDDATASELKEYAESYELKNNYTQDLATPEKFLFAMLTGDSGQAESSAKYDSSGLPAESSTELSSALVRPLCQSEATPNPAICSKLDSPEERDAIPFTVPSEPFEDDSTSTSKKSPLDMNSESEVQQFQIITANYESTKDTISETINTSDDVFKDPANSLPDKISSNTPGDSCTTFESAATQSESIDAQENRSGLSVSSENFFLATGTESIRTIPLDKSHRTLVPESNITSAPVGLELFTASTNSINTCAMADDILEARVEHTSASDITSSARTTHMATSIPIEVPSPPRHTAEKPNWALAPETSPKHEAESNKKRRKRAPRRGRNIKPESGSQKPMPQSSKKNLLGAQKMPPKTEREHLKDSELPGSFVSTNGGTSRKKKSPSRAPDSAVVPYDNTPKGDEAAQHPLSCLDTHVESISGQSFSLMNSRPTVGPDNSLRTDTFTSSGPKHKPNVVSLSQVPSKNITGRLKEPSANQSMIKDETRRYIPSRSFKRELVGGKKECNPHEPVKKPGPKSTNNQRPSISRSSEEESNRIGLFQSSINGLTRQSTHPLDKHLPAGIKEGLPVPTGNSQSEAEPSKTTLRPVQTNANSITETTIKTHDEWRFGEFPNSSQFSTVLPAEPFSQITAKEVYTSVGQPLLLGGTEAGRSKHSIARLTSESSKGEEKMAVRFLPVGSNNAFRAATKSQHGPSNEPLAGNDGAPTVRVNLPQRRSGSLPESGRIPVEGQHGYRRSFQSNIPVATKRNASKDHAATPAPGPLLLQQALYGSDLGQGDRSVCPDIMTAPSPSQNTFHTSGMTHTSLPTAQLYSRRATIDTIGYASNADTLFQNRLTNSEQRINRTGPIPRSHAYGTNVGRQGMMYVFPTGPSENQGSMHRHQHNAAYRTQHRQHQFGNPQPPDNATALGQPQTARFPTDFIYRTPQGVPFHRELSGSYLQLPDYANHSNQGNLR